MAKLTKSFIDKVQSPETGYGIHWDDTVKGYGLRVTAAGKRSFVAQGRVRGKAVIVTIGPYGTYTEDQARKRAQSVLQDMRDGIDPRDAKRQDEAAKVTLSDVADAYVARPGKLKASSKATVERHIATTFQAWADKPIAGIREDDVRKRYREMATKGLRGNGPAPGQANQSMAILRALINFAGRQYKRADGTRLVSHNPVDALKDDWVELKPRTRDIDTKKVGAVWHTLTVARVAAQDREAEAGVDLVRFLLLTGARISEGGSLEWKNVNLDEGWWHIPDPKNSNPVWLPLSSQAAELLKARAHVEGSPYVFASRSKAGYIKDPRQTLAKVSKAAGLHLSAHDLRRTFVTVGVTVCGIDLHKLELLTNHVPKGVTARHYLQTSRLHYLGSEVQRIADWIAEQGRVAAILCNSENVML
jgi:integrase